MQVIKWYSLGNNTVVEANIIRGWQTQKKATIFVVAITVFILVACSSLRCIPALDDWLSGPPQYLHVLADMHAVLLATAAGNESPVLVIRDDNQSCVMTDQTANQEITNIYYVFFYSEANRSLCMIYYADAIVSGSLVPSKTLTPGTGQNFGRAFSAPVNVYPVFHSVSIYPNTYLSLLHWRTDSKYPNTGVTGDIQPKGFSTRSMPGSNRISADISYNDLRAAVAQRHNDVNKVLNTSIVICVLLVCLSCGRLGTLYQRMRRECGPNYPKLHLSIFLLEDLNLIHEQAKKARQLAQQEAFEQHRAATLLTRSRETLKTRLESRLHGLESIAENEAERRRIEEALAQADPETMMSVLNEVEPHIGQRTPEQRTTLLLESLKEFCTPEEFERCRAEAIGTLTRQDFRQARAYIVAKHEEFRIRAKKLEEKALNADNNGIG